MIRRSDRHGELRRTVATMNDPQLLALGKEVIDRADGRPSVVWRLLDYALARLKLQPETGALFLISHVREVEEKLLQLRYPGQPWCVECKHPAWIDNVVGVCGRWAQLTEARDTPGEFERQFDGVCSCPANIHYDVKAHREWLSSPHEPVVAGTIVAGASPEVGTTVDASLA